MEQATGGKVKAEDLRPDINWEYVREQQKNP
ncbi:helix-turn-helix domain-containing protein [Moraxella catarrhalis]|nr:YdaS family helix-turn-helix protein [Moraxella catarrhalis]